MTDRQRFTAQCPDHGWIDPGDMVAADPVDDHVVVDDHPGGVLRVWLVPEDRRRWRITHWLAPTGRGQCVFVGTLHEVASWND